MMKEEEVGQKMIIEQVLVFVHCFLSCAFASSSSAAVVVVVEEETAAVLANFSVHFQQH